MKNVLPCIFIFLLLSCSFATHAQNEPIFSQVWLNRSTFNPSYTAQVRKTEAAILFKLHSFKPQSSLYGPGGTPLALNTFFNHRISRRHGVGINLFAHKIGRLNSMQSSISYSYVPNLHLKGKLAFGVILNHQIEHYTAFDAYENPGPIPISQDFFAAKTHRNLKLGFGTSYMTHKIKTGISLTNLNVKNQNPQKTDPQIHFNTSYLTLLTYKHYITSYLYFQSDPRLNRSQFQIASILTYGYKSKISIGAGFQQGSAVSLYLAKNIRRHFNVHYGLNRNIKGTSTYNPFSHELSITYNNPLHVIKCRIPLRMDMPRFP